MCVSKKKPNNINIYFFYIKKSFINTINIFHKKTYSVSFLEILHSNNFCVLNTFHLVLLFKFLYIDVHGSAASWSLR